MDYDSIILALSASVVGGLIGVGGAYLGGKWSHNNNAGCITLNNKSKLTAFLRQSAMS
jgi:hypothetical protein